MQQDLQKNAWWLTAIKHQHADYYYVLAYSFESLCLYDSHTQIY